MLGCKFWERILDLVVLLVSLWELTDVSFAFVLRLFDLGKDGEDFRTAASLCF